MSAAAIDDMPFRWENHKEAEVRPRCHPDAPMWCRIDRVAHLTLTCARYGEAFLTVATKKAVADDAEVRLR